MGLEPKSARKPRKPNNYGAFGTAGTPDDRYLFGTDAEIADRVATGYVTNPAGAAPKFEQIRPGPTGKDANSPSPKSYSGNFKYGNGRRYV